MHAANNSDYEYNIYSIRELYAYNLNNSYKTDIILYTLEGFNAYSIQLWLSL